jgi:N-acetylneuraminic acid mutarotase
MNTVDKSLTIMAILLVLLSTLHLSSAAEGGTWISKAPMPTARGGLGVVSVDGKIYAIGGMNNNSYLSVNEEYDPVTDKWTTKTPMPTARSGFAIAVYRNRIYIFGGTTGNSTADSSGFTGVTEVYTPGTDTWTTKATMPTPRADLSASVIDGKIFLIGGKKYVENDPYYVECYINEAYDPGSDSWTNKTAIPIATFGYASAVIDNKIYILGGGVQFWGRWDFTSVEANQIYDAENDEWSNGVTFVPSLSYMAASTTSGIDAYERIYVVGGFSSEGYSNLTHVYNPKTSTWSTITPMPTPRIYLGSVVLNDTLYAIGGYANDNWFNNNELYTPSEYGLVPPDLHILSPQSKLYRDVELTFIVNKATQWIGYSLDGQVNITINGNTTLHGLSQGEHRIILYANDSRGNMGSAISSIFSVDIQPPIIKILSPENKTYDSTDIKSVFTVDEQVVSIDYSLDDGPKVSVTGNVTLPPLSEGSHKLTFYAQDTVGNLGNSDTVYFNIQLFPTTLVIAAVATVVIVSSAVYLFFRRRKIRT